MTPDEFSALIPDYALGLLEPAQSAALEAALRYDAGLAAELAEYEALLGELGSFVPQFDPPPALEARILAQIGPHKEAFAFGRYTLAWAAIFLLALIGLGFFLRGKGSPDPIQSILESEVSQFKEISGSELQPELKGRFIWNEEIRRGLLELENLHRLEADQAYQVWFVSSEEKRISASLFQSPPERPLLLELPDQFWETYRFVGMTIEPATGSPEPTSPPVFLLALSDH